VSDAEFHPRPPPLPYNPQAPGHRASSAPREAQYRQVQKQLLTDVASVRSRQKEQAIRDRLRRTMVVSRVIRPGYGEVVVYEHEFVNPFSQEMVGAV
jgi:nephrocystin-4